jgi:hypothetical protein
MSEYSTHITKILNQFEGSPDLLKLIEVLFGPIEEAQTLIEYLRDNTNLNDAEGVWLDVIGVILGLERPYKEQDPGTIFTTKNETNGPSDPYKGCLDPLTGVGGYLQSAEGITDISDPTARETDTNYRKLLRAKTFALNALGTFADIHKYLKDGFDVRSELESPETGLIQITLEDFLSQREREHVKAFGPRLAGVRIEFLNWPPEGT